MKRKKKDYSKDPSKCNFCGKTLGKDDHYDVCWRCNIHYSKNEKKEDSFGAILVTGFVFTMILILFG